MEQRAADMLLPKIPLHTTHEWILGKHRIEWVVGACKALIAASDLHLRWTLIRRGQDEFIRWGLEKFPLFEPGIRYSPDELRWMFATIDATLPPKFREAMESSEIQDLMRRPVITDAQLKGTGGEGPTGHEGPTERYGDSDITVETLPDNQKRLVH